MILVVSKVKDFRGRFVDVKLVPQSEKSLINEISIMNPTSSFDLSVNSYLFFYLS